MTIRFFTKSGESKIHIESFDFSDRLEMSLTNHLRLVDCIERVLSLNNINASGIDIYFEADVSNPQLTSCLMRNLLLTNNDPAHSRLTFRELNVLKLICLGLTNKEISENLSISFETVRSHRKNILKKVGAKNTAALVSRFNSASPIPAS